MNLILPLLTATVLSQAAPPTPPPTQPTPPPSGVPVAPAAAPGAVPTSPAATPTPAPTVIQAIAPWSNRYINWSQGTIYETSFRVSINSRDVQKTTAPLRFPVLLNSGSSLVDLPNISALVRLAGTITEQGGGVDILTPTASTTTFQIEAPTPPLPPNPNTLNNAIQMQFEIEQTIACFASQVDELAMASIPWPAAWPPEVAGALQPQPLIESNAPIFANAVQSITQGNLRQVSPWIAAKEIVRYCCTNIQANSTITLRGPNSSIRGLDVQGAARTVSAGRGTACDLVCVCVAMLRSAGIPARPVIGVGKYERSSGSSEKNSFLIWGEFYLPDAGWIPFDPKSLEKSGVRSWGNERSWKGFGNMRDLNKQIPLAHAFTPGTEANAYDAWSVWGWSRLRTARQIPMPIEVWKAIVGDRSLLTGGFSTPSFIRFTFVNRGRYKE